MKKIFLFVLILLLSIFPSNFVKANNEFPNELKYNFHFYCEHDNDELDFRDPGNLFDKFKYYFPDGKKLEISEILILNPNIILLINGTRFETNVNLINKNNNILIPVSNLCNILNLKLDWIEKDNEFIINTLDKKIKLKVNSNIANINNNEYKIKQKPIIVNNLVYVPLRFVCEEIGLEVKYYNFKDIYLFYKTSIITIDSKLNIPYISQEEAYNYLKNKLEKAYNKFPENYRNYSLNNFGKKIDEYNIENSSQALKKDIDNLKFRLNFSKYYIFEGLAYTIYFDKYNNDVYFHITEINFEELKKINFDDPELFLDNYMVN